MFIKLKKKAKCSSNKCVATKQAMSQNSPAAVLPLPLQDKGANVNANSLHLSDGSSVL
jgi:hypothetical protein